MTVDADERPNPESGGEGGDTKPKLKDSTPNSVDQELMDKYVSEKVNESLKDIKGKLDGAFTARDEALRKIAEFEKKERDAEVKRLKEEGKEREAFEMQLAQERARVETLERQNTELTRDVEVRGLLSNLTFRNDKAVEMAYQDIVGQLVRDERGHWVHRSGIPVKEFIKHFAESDDNAFLFKPKTSTGSGGSGPKTNSGSSGDKGSLFKMSQAEVIKMAAEGKLGKK